MKKSDLDDINELIKTTKTSLLASNAEINEEASKNKTSKIGFVLGALASIGLFAIMGNLITHGHDLVSLLVSFPAMASILATGVAFNGILTSKEKQKKAINKSNLYKSLLQGYESSKQKEHEEKVSGLVLNSSYKRTTEPTITSSQKQTKAVTNDKNKKEEKEM